MGRSLDDDRAATTFTNPGTSHRLATLTDARSGLAARLPEQLTWGALMGALIGPVSCVSCVSWMHWVYAAETHETFH